MNTCPPAPERAYIGFGANLGNTQDAFNYAQSRLAALTDTQLVTHSALYRSAPVGVTNQPDYVNAVFVLDTRLSPETLLSALLDIEQRGGRTRTYRYAPRTLDLDLLLYGHRIIRQPQLQVPHPRMHERAFVLIPLAEVAPDISIPGHGQLSSLLPGVREQRIQPVSSGI